MLNLKNVTLVGLDCVNLERLQLARDICVRDIEFGAVILLSSIASKDKDVIRIEPVNSLKEYSEFMIKRLFEYVDTDFVLIIQHDGFVLSAANWRDEFLNYDYIGAPWIGYYKERPEHNVGNGGFSLRSKKLLEILAHDPNITMENPWEDGVICRDNREYLESKGIKFAPMEIAGKFSIPDLMKQNDTAFTDLQYREYLAKQGIKIDSKEQELQYQIPEAYQAGGLRWTDQFGCHYNTRRHLEKWLEQNPEYKGKIKPED